jgi:hypothetical protein
VKYNQKGSANISLWGYSSLKMNLLIKELENTTNPRNLRIFEELRHFSIHSKDIVILWYNLRMKVTWLLCVTVHLTVD